MMCPECRRDNPPAQKFCGECGARLVAACASCGSANPPEHKFCGECGTRLSPAAAPDTPKFRTGQIPGSQATLEGERKQVTVLFADLKGSMELLADRDPEDARKILDAVLHRMMEAVHHYEGTVNQVMGDGIMALFGAPVAHEDHAVRACYAALRMQETVRRQADQLREADGVDVRIRIGLNSGEVVVRSIGSDLGMDYTAVGLTTHLAARMEQLARPGSVLVTANTFRLVEGLMEAAPQGALRVKGLAEPVAAYELTRVTGAQSRLEVAAARGLTPFVGRDAEMAALHEAATRVADGRGQVVAIVGEPGVGKSRLVLEFTRSGLPRDWAVLEAHATPYGKDVPYLPILELLGRRFGTRPGDDAAAARQRLTAALGREASARLLSPIMALMALPVDDPEWTRLDAGLKRRRTVEAVKHALMTSGREQPTAVVVEDLHWADAETLAVLDALVASAGGTPLLILASYRPEHRHEWSGRTYYRQIAIDALSADDTATLLDRVLGPAASLAQIKRMLADRIGGNPFFVEESVRNLVESGALIGERGAYHAASVPAVTDVPGTVFAVLAARIDRLPWEDKRLLQTASAIGRDVPRALLDAIADVPADAVAESLARLQASEFLHETALFPEIEYTFRHALTHDVAYASLTRERRRALDARIVGALETRRSDDDSRDIDRLARHATRGEMWDRAVRYSRAAGQRALAQWHAHRVGAAYFEQAIAALAHLPADPSSTALAIDLRLELRYALGPLGQYRRMSELLTEAKELAQAAGDHARLALVSCLLCNAATLRFELAPALAHGARALDIAARIDDPALATATHSMLSLAYYLAGDYRRAADSGRLAERAEGDVWRERFGLVVPPAVYGASVGSWALAELGEFSEAHRMASRGVSAAEALNHPHAIAFACLGLGIVYVRQGLAAPAVGALERAMRVSAPADLPAVFLELAGPLASAYVLAGRAADALALLTRAVEQAVEMRHRLGHALRTGGMAEALLAADRAGEAAPLARLYVDLARAAHSTGALAWGLHLLAEVATHSSPPDADTAEEALAEALALADGLGMRPLAARTLFTRGQLLERLGRRDEARAAVAEATERFNALDMVSWAAASATRLRAWPR